MNGAAVWTSKNGVILAADYPYTSGRTGLAGACLSANMTTQKLQTANAFNWVNYGKTAFKTALLSQPMVVGFEVSNSFYYYATGVYTPTDCTYKVNHAM